MNWSDERPSWLPPLPRPNRGRGLISTGVVILAATFIFIIAMAYVGGTHTLLTLVPIIVGVVLVVVGFRMRNGGW